MVTESTEVNEAMFGGNASAEGGEDEAAGGDISKSGCNIVLANRLQDAGLDKKGFQTYIKVFIVLSVLQDFSSLFFYSAPFFHSSYIP